MVFEESKAGVLQNFSPVPFKVVVSVLAFRNSEGYSQVKGKFGNGKITIIQYEKLATGF